MRLTKLRQHSPSRRYRRDQRLVAAIAVCFSLMIASFVVSRTITEVQSRRIQREANSISQNALLAAEALIAVRTSLCKVTLAMNALSTSEAPPVVSQLATELEVFRGEVATSWAHYLSYPFYTGEKVLAENVEPDLTSVEQAIDTVVGRLRNGDRQGALSTVADHGLPSIVRSDEKLGHNLELNRHEAEAAATRITASSRDRGLLPEFVGAFFAIALAYFGVRILVLYLAWSAEKSAELEWFAGRVEKERARYAALIEAVGNIVWTASPQGEASGPQPTWRAYTGQSEEEMQEDWSMAVHPDDVQPTMKAWKQALATQSPFAFEHRLRRRDGVYRWFAIRAVPVLDTNGAIREWVGLDRDIDEERRLAERERTLREHAEDAARELRASEVRFRASLLGSGAALFEQDAALRYTWFHSPYPGIPVLGQTDAQSFPPDEAKLLTDLKRRALDGESVCTEISLTVEGEARRYREVIEPTRDRSGTIAGVMGSATDITEETRTRERLREALRFREELMGILGHDLRNPVNAAAMATGALLRQCDLSDPHRRKVEIIKRATDRMTEMISTLLDFTRVRSYGKMTISPVATDLGALAGEVVDESRAVETDRTIVLDLRGDLRGQWDPARIKQVVSNLVTNALHHGDPQKPVQISLDGLSTEVTLKVKNEGPPIPVEVRPVLFEAFTRGPSDPSIRGLGLGLYIVKHITVAHGGTIDVESSSNAGTTFTLVLPR